ncbi:hypothetical protein [Methylobacterium nodulans]|uniref:hypothetical protein n=1 Tax=Methylobacterium nodulans TaxID=114616 RepID=UPI0012ED5A5C|nr:hypothetical protein [Methylobacterium nodulans]
MKGGQVMRFPDDPFGKRITKPARRGAELRAGVSEAEIRIAARLRQQSPSNQPDFG